MEAEAQNKYAHHHTKHVAVNTTQPDNVKFHNTQTEIIHTCITATQRHLNITLDAAVQTTLADFKDTPEQLQSISTRIYSMHQDITRWME